MLEFSISCNFNLVIHLFDLYKGFKKQFFSFVSNWSFQGCVK